MYLEGGQAEDRPLRVLVAEGRDLHGHSAVCVRVAWWELVGVHAQRREGEVAHTTRTHTSSRTARRGRVKNKQKRHKFPSYPVMPRPGTILESSTMTMNFLAHTSTIFSRRSAPPRPYCVATGTEWHLGVWGWLVGGMGLDWVTRLSRWTDGRKYDAIDNTACRHWFPHSPSLDE